MHWDDEAILLAARKFSERDAVVTLFTSRHGLCRALAKGALTNRQRATFQPGNIVQARWNARLAEHLGAVACETLEPCAARLMGDAIALAGWNAAASLLAAALAERDPHPELYARAKDLTMRMAHAPPGASHPAWLAAYALFELEVLRESGFGLDLRHCAATGQTDDLAYVSPKSGRAVCRAAGAPYHAKLLPLPAFLLRASEGDPGAAAPADILAALRVTGYFLASRLCAAREGKLPEARERFAARLLRATPQEAEAPLRETA